MFFMSCLRILSFGFHLTFSAFYFLTMKEKGRTRSRDLFTCLSYLGDLHHHSNNSKHIDRILKHLLFDTVKEKIMVWVKRNTTYATLWIKIKTRQY